MPAVSDYGYASSACYSSTKLQYYYQETCQNTNWMQITVGTDGVTNEWTMHPYNYQTRVYSMNQTYTQGITGTYSNTEFNVRPTIYLDSSVYILSGNGSDDYPYVLGI